MNSGSHNARKDRWRPWVLAALLGVGAGVFCIGITWGLPSRASDPYLFGDKPVWSGEKILQLTGDQEVGPSRGADVDANPLRDRDQIIWINATDQQRAGILIRYRLFTHHPDEMVTMMALASMSPGSGDLDPKLYQYGGLWIYPVGVLLKAASMCGAITLTSDLTYYLDHPEAFGRFYVVARVYVVAWALIGVWIVFWIVRRLTGGCIVTAAMAALCYIVMPVVINMAHEAKPHLPGAVLTLLAAGAAMRYVETVRRWWWIAMAVLCGAALGMVLTAWPVFAVLLVAEWMREQPWGKRLRHAVAGVLTAGAVYCVTNPYVWVNLFTHRELLWSNLGNTQAMFHPSMDLEGLRNAVWLISAGTSPLLVLVGIVGCLGLLVRTVRRYSGSEVGDSGSSSTNLGWLLVVPAILNVVQFAIYAAGQSGQYGRFALLADIGLGIAALVAIRLFVQPVVLRCLLVAFVVVLTALAGGVYLKGFVEDRTAETSRLLAAERLKQLREMGTDSVGVLCEPAPYSMPPVDLFRWKIFLLPASESLAAAAGSVGALIRPDVSAIKPEAWIRSYDELASDLSIVCSPYIQRRAAVAPLSWANRRFDVLIRKTTLRPHIRSATKDAP